MVGLVLWLVMELGVHMHGHFAPMLYNTRVLAWLALYSLRPLIIQPSRPLAQKLRTQPLANTSLEPQPKFQPPSVQHGPSIPQQRERVQRTGLIYLRHK